MKSKIYWRTTQEVRCPLIRYLKEKSIYIMYNFRFVCGLHEFIYSHQYIRVSPTVLQIDGFCPGRGHGDDAIEYSNLQRLADLG